MTYHEYKQFDADADVYGQRDAGGHQCLGGEALGLWVGRV